MSLLTRVSTHRLSGLVGGVGGPSHASSLLSRHGRLVAVGSGGNCVDVLDALDVCEPPERAGAAGAPACRFRTLGCIRAVVVDGSPILVRDVAFLRGGLLAVGGETQRGDMGASTALTLSICRQEGATGMSPFHWHPWVVTGGRASR
jgi:hypothetical protein